MGLHKRGRTGSAQHKRAHKGAHRGAQGAHNGRTGSRTAHVFPNFFAFQAREMKFDEQIWWQMVLSNSPWHTVISNSLWHTVISKTDRLIFVNFHDHGVMKIDEKESA